MGHNFPKVNKVAAPSSQPTQLPSPAKDTAFDAQKIQDVATKAFAPDHDKLSGQGEGTLNHFQAVYGSEPRGRLSYLQLGDYPAARNGLAMTVKNAYDHVSSIYSSFLTSYDGFVKSLAKTGQNYGSAEDANTQNAQNVHNPKKIV